MRHFIVLLFAAAASAQVVSVGVKAGVPVTPAVRTYGQDTTTLLDTGRWTIGPTVEVRLVYGFSVEADALYRGYRLQQSFASSQFTLDGVTFAPIFSSFRTDNKVWDFPLLLKYRIGSRSYRPFVAAGYTWSHRTSDVNAQTVCLGTADVCSASPYKTNVGHVESSGNSSGPTAGIGVEFRLKRFRIAPEVRYTHLSNPNANNATVLVGFAF